MATTIDKTEARLQNHEEICLIRYTAINEKMDQIDQRFDKLETDIKELKDSNGKNMSEIKSMLTAAKDEKFKVMVTVAGTVIVSLLGMLSYVIIHLPK